jgi:hypothetical protein
VAAAAAEPTAVVAAPDALAVTAANPAAAVAAAVLALVLLETVVRAEREKCGLLAGKHSSLKGIIYINAPKVKFKYW